ncbi:hypothetical protein A6A29_37190 [Streptomyces sp. TSRI0281]|nr:hypothetical protein A6A29_37190 [Streptomyces sp. TSRI0281]
MQFLERQCHVGDGAVSLERNLVPERGYSPSALDRLADVEGHDGADVIVREPTRDANLPHRGRPPTGGRPSHDDARRR